MAENKNELALSGKDFGNHLIPNLFSDIDFEGLNSVIDNMAQASGTLTDEDKGFARDIIAEWNDTVVSRLNTKYREARDFINFFETSNMTLNIGHLALEDFGRDMAEKTNTVALYEDVLSTMEAAVINKASEPQRPAKDPDMTLAEDIKQRQEYEAAYTIFRLKQNKLDRAHALAIGDWKRAMNQHETVKDLLAHSRKLSNGYSKMTETAKQKAQLAKLSITISNDEARDSLKELLQFSATI